MKKLGCALLVILAFLAGMKWEERVCTKEKRAQLDAVFTEFQKEINARGKTEKMAKVIAVENERLRAENAQLEARVKDCKPVPETKSVVPRKKKPRAFAVKPPVNVVQPKKPSLPKPQPKDEEVIKVVVAPAPKEVLPQKKEPCPDGEMKVVAGKWPCVKEEPTPPVVPTPTDDFFANAVDEEVEVQAPVQTPAQVTPVYVTYEPLSRVNCMTEPFRDSDGRFYPAGFQHDRRSNGMCRCGSRGCDLRWP